MSALKKVWRTLRGIMRELSDQSAYERHLRAHGYEHSPAAWRHFQDCQAKRRFTRPKCC